MVWQVLQGGLVGCLQGAFGFGIAGTREPVKKGNTILLEIYLTLTAFLLLIYFLQKLGQQFHQVAPSFSLAPSEYLNIYFHVLF